MSCTIMYKGCTIFNTLNLQHYRISRNFAADFEIKYLI